MDIKLFSNGNMKVGKNTLIFNMNSATDCPSDKLGLCALSAQCYAKSSERQYPAVLPYRRRQEKVWEITTPKDFVKAFMEVAKSKKKVAIKYLRFSEAGDFKSKADVVKMTTIARLLKKEGIITYGYTARNDLDFRGLKRVAVGSSFMGSNEFKPVTEFTNTNPKCNGSDCSKCTLCKLSKGSIIEVMIH